MVPLRSTIGYQNPQLRRERHANHRRLAWERRAGHDSESRATLESCDIVFNVAPPTMRPKSLHRLRE